MTKIASIEKNGIFPIGEPLKMNTSLEQHTWKCF